MIHNDTPTIMAAVCARNKGCEKFAETLRRRLDERARTEKFDLFPDELPRVSDCRVGGTMFPRRHVPAARQARGVRTGGPQRDMQVQTGLPHRHRVQAYQRQEQFLRPR